MVSTDEFREALGQRIRALRKGAGLTQEQLGERAGISAKYVSNVENGEVNPSISVLNELASRGFGISLSALFNFSLQVDEAHRVQDEIVLLSQSLSPQDLRRALGALGALVASFGPVE
jgi:transcriptional regulator with XRE-family HTH domain